MVEVLLITHGKIAESMYQVAEGIMPEKAKSIHIVPWSLSAGAKYAPENLETVIEDIDQGDGVLILTDICGATPYNVVKHLTQITTNEVRVVCGLNLPMLLRVLNYIEKPLDQLVDIASDGGHRGIIAE
ncbi:MAG: PTS fructose IIA subunit family protein [Gammaproteobacteria bacterium]|nr:MAG: PTS fructose IIA subunit family protein [Gammaproteobacteria bacterium]UTW42929.1 PTS fructose IIA subunit family protein [bacterium SCSIO 12844]